MAVNARFPHALADAPRPPRRARRSMLTTDGVFSGRDGGVHGGRRRTTPTDVYAQQQERRRGPTRHVV